MNNHRLSTNFLSYTENLDFIPNSQLDSVVTDLLNKSNIELHSNGKFWIKSKKSYNKGGIGRKIEAISICNTVKKEFNSISESAKFFKVSEFVIRYKINNNKPLNFEDKDYYFYFVESELFSYFINS